MDIGIPKEIKPQEGRVAMMPGHVLELTQAGHKVRIETNAGALSGVEDQHYAAGGAEIALAPVMIRRATSNCSESRSLSAMPNLSLPTEIS